MTVDRHELSMQPTNRPAMTDYIDAGLRQLASRLRSATVVLCAFACTAAFAARKRRQRRLSELLQAPKRQRMHWSRP